MSLGFGTVSAIVLVGIAALVFVMRTVKKSKKRLAQQKKDAAKISVKLDKGEVPDDNYTLW